MTTITMMSTASYRSAFSPCRSPRAAEMIAAMIRTITSTSTNWLSKMRRGFTLAVWTSSFAPKRASRRAASCESRPKGEASSRLRTASAGKECQSSAIVRRTLACVIKLISDIRRNLGRQGPSRVDNGFL